MEILELKNNWNKLSTWKNGDDRKESVKMKIEQQKSPTLNNREKKKTEKNESLGGLGDISKRFKVNVIRVSESREKMWTWTNKAWNVPNWAKDTSLNVQEADWTPNKINPK